MNTHANKTQENKSQSVENKDSQKQKNGRNTFQFVDNRPQAIVQRKLQELADNSPQVKRATQLQALADSNSTQQQQPIQKKVNNTGLPDNLKSGIENLSGYAMDDVRVHYNSDKPAQLQAHAYAQGTNIYLASGQEKHLPHEAWHVVQQKQGRVKPTLQLKGGVNVNDDLGLEKEADIMGAKALGTNKPKDQITNSFQENNTVQRNVDNDLSETFQYLDITQNYEASTIAKIYNYAENIKHTDTNIDGNLASKMSNGLKVWAQNYYNKSQAYLYEGQKANDFTTPDSRFAILGHDTDLNPDIEIHERQVQNGKDNWSGGIAHELKASTSENYDAVYQLVLAGIKQLKKRQDLGNQYGENFKKLLLTVHNDDPKNAYPITDNMLKNNYGNNPNNVPSNDWNKRLESLLAGTIVHNGITIPIEVRMEFNGTRYATATFNT